MNREIIRFKLWGTKNRNSIIEINTHFFSALINNYVVVSEDKFKELCNQNNIKADKMLFIIKENGKSNRTF